MKGRNRPLVGLFLHSYMQNKLGKIPKNNLKKTPIKDFILS